MEFLWSHLETNPVLCVDINYKLKATYPDVRVGEDCSNDGEMEETSQTGR